MFWLKGFRALTNHCWWLQKLPGRFWNELPSTCGRRLVKFGPSDLILLLLGVFLKEMKTLKEGKGCVDERSPLCPTGNTD